MRQFKTATKVNTLFTEIYDCAISIKSLSIDLINEIDTDHNLNAKVVAIKQLSKYMLDNLQAMDEIVDTA